jgi:hypothetical protein
MFCSHLYRAPGGAVKLSGWLRHASVSAGGRRAKNWPELNTSQQHCDHTRGTAENRSMAAQPALLSTRAGSRQPEGEG